jgi:hypothetical protein
MIMGFSPPLGRLVMNDPEIEMTKAIFVHNVEGYDPSIRSNPFPTAHDMDNVVSSISREPLAKSVILYQIAHHLLCATSTLKQTKRPARRRGI